ncbi:N-acetylmuramoyl-L-alanine amidase [Brevibacterium sp. JSBI002]|uniref:N-acetylmuramoyl-L-alanine amidase n=1 Tax=Brevibacterium sp. JSBI002 TaxID=2886045 RepID=UPI002231F142|nr:N-acetylmuramoyl-L-alanine amidase [Brevibacterium sp. JSBI002]UZD61008.1 N-acetylmuramoyl-L-alanine amidase [Brevibacterium sp. JSBI002]
MPHRLLVPSLILTAALSLPGLAACSQDAGAPGQTTQAAETTGKSPTAGNGGDGGDDAKSAAASAKEEEADLEGKVIAIDPGHNGGNADHPEKINRQVPDGRGGTKACNTTGTSTNSDYPEADFTWAVAKKLEKSLTDAGAEVVLSRKDNKGVGPCVDERGTFADDADLLVSIHANGSESSSVKGFHIIVADPGEDEKTEKKSVDLAKSVGSSMGEEFTPNKAYGKDAISRRPDLAGLNNASVPAVIVECGEMRNPSEAKLMESKSGQRRYADALFDGIVDWF